MDRQFQTPWPRSWPPFWRTCLHVALVTGIGNVALLLLVATLHGFLDDLAGLSFVIPLWSALVAWISALLVRSDGRTTGALVASVFVGTFGTVLATTVLLEVFFQHFWAYERTFRHARSEYWWLVAPFAASFLISLPIAAVGFALMVLMFRPIVPAAAWRRIRLAGAVGSVLFPFSTAWALLVVNLPTFSSSTFVSLLESMLPLSLFVPMSLTYSVTARLLATAAGQAARDEGPSAVSKTCPSEDGQNEATKTDAPCP